MRGPSHARHEARQSGCRNAQGLAPATEIGPETKSCFEVRRAETAVSPRVWSKVFLGGQPAVHRMRDQRQAEQLEQQENGHQEEKGK